MQESRRGFLSFGRGAFGRRAAPALGRCLERGDEFIVAGERASFDQFGAGLFDDVQRLE